MPKALRICACVIVLVAAATPAAADWHLTPFIGVTVGGTTTFPDIENEAAGRRFAAGHRQLGIAVTRTLSGPIGFEGLIAYVPGIFDRRESGDLLVLSSRTASVMGNIVVTLPRNWNQYGLRPFASGGFGLVHVAQTWGQTAINIRANALGYDVGGGAIGSLSDRTGVRFEARYISYVRPKETEELSFGRATFSYWSINVGYVIRLQR